MGHHYLRGDLFSNGECGVYDGGVIKDVQGPARFITS